MKKIVDFCKREMVLCIALVLGAVSSLIILPDSKYLEYIDFRTLAILFCLMSVMEGLKKIGVFRWIAERLLERVRSIGQLMLILVMLCFVSGMFITNDVALIAFVPFSFTVLRLLGEEQRGRLIIPLVVMETIGANMGSMMTPIGNPQNLYLYGKAGLTFGQFVILMMPYTLLALILLLVWCFGFATVLSKGSKEKKESCPEGHKSRGKGQGMSSPVIRFEHRTTLGDGKKQLPVYLILFVMCLLTVVRVVPYGITLAVVIGVVFLMDKKILARVDYSLLLTFVGFFVFIGNMGRIPAFSTFLQDVVAGNEVLAAVSVSQVISNVPAALLLSGFTMDYQALIIGVNLGGLGTLIASMASLISYKFVVREESGKKGKYLLHFTAVGICFLIAMVILYVCIA